jgi:septum formation protein
LKDNIKLILASASQSRADILSRASIQHLSISSDIDEDSLKQTARDEGIDVKIVTQRLALSKAVEVGKDYPEKFVLGCDQILDCEGVWFDKPKTLNEARTHLENLRGKTHRLVNGLVIVHEGSVIWTHTAIATLSMRDFSNTFLEKYLNISGQSILGSVGAYRLEAYGVHLFDTIDGDYFTILGLPLLPLLSFLREQDVLDW